MLYFNAQSLFANLSQLGIIAHRTKPAMILLSEARLTNEIQDGEVQISYYKIFRTDSSSRHTGGVAIYVRNDISVKKVERLIFERNLWLLALNVKIDNWCGTIVCIYHSPSSSDNDFVQELFKWTEDNIDENDNIWICGDFNIDWMRDSVTKNCIFEKANDLGLMQLVKQPTRITSTSSTLIDLCFSNDHNMRCNINSEYNISDHECICIRFNNIANNETKFKLIETVKYNRNDFINELRKE